MPIEVNKLPWFTQEDAIQIVQAFQKNHAVLLNGARGIGKSYLASMVTRQLFVNSLTDATSHLIEAGTHPDVHVLTSAFGYQFLHPQLQKFCFRYLDHDAISKKRLSRQIGIDAIRALVDSMNEASSSGEYKLSIIYPAEHLNINSANAILKFLEEPTAKTYLILISHDSSKLTATIRSRCMRINLAVPDTKTSLEWMSANYPQKNENEINGALELASYRPLLAAQYLSADQQTLATQLEIDLTQLLSHQAACCINVASQWAQCKQTDFILSWIVKFFTQLIKIKLMPAQEKEHSNINKHRLLANLYSSEGLFNTYDYLTSIKSGYDGIVDETLLIEDILQTISNNKD